jgi:CDP-paratose 2-epimerase
MTKKYLITGGAGFIGSNYVSRLLKRGESVSVFDNLSRAGTSLNLEWIRTTYGDHSFELIKGDVRDSKAVASAIRDADVIVHLAAQVAVTTSVHNPREDFEINALGTFNVLEAARESNKKPTVIYASTNKVYGGMDEVTVLEDTFCYRYKDFPLGISEIQPLDFHSPYGCSKGSGDQYMHDYYRIYDLPTVVFRQSCIYGPRQFGIEDQGWLAWFVIAAVTGRKISIYGDGKQVRDVLFVEDLLDAYDAAIANPERAAGQIYNVGGGPENTISVWKEFAPILEGAIGHSLPVSWGDWRPGDQRIYVSDIRKAREELGWQPKFNVKDGLRILIEWVKENRQLF